MYCYIWYCLTNLEMKMYLNFVLTDKVSPDVVIAETQIGYLRLGCRHLKVILAW